MTLQIISTKDSLVWDFYLEQVDRYDIYHTCLYHSLCTEGDSRLLVFQEKESIMLLPLVFRKIPGTDWMDVTSVYGYVGWVSRHPAFTPELFDLLEEYLIEQKVVSVFSRLHPFIDQSDCFLKGEVKVSNITTGIDMSLSPLEQVAGYSRSVRYQISKSKREGVEVFPAETIEDLHCFVDIYLETMKRKEAPNYYLFPNQYFEQLWQNNSFQTIVLLAKLNGEVIAGGMFTICQGIMQYHLGGVRSDCLQYSPLKVLIDEARKRAIEEGCAYFHLGGGYGGMDDHLFVFKSRLTTVRYSFKTFRWIINQKHYNLLSKEKKDVTFFPLYRSID